LGEGELEGAEAREEREEGRTWGDREGHLGAWDIVALVADGWLTAEKGQVRRGVK